MKKIVLSLVALVVLGLVALYAFIPTRLDVSESTQIDCTIDGGFRILSNEMQWNKWWPGESSSIISTGTHFIFKKDSFYFAKISHNILDIDMTHKGLSLSSQMSLIPLPNNTLAVEWHTFVPTGLNPFSRYKHYREAISIKENIHSILSALQAYLSKKENIYGLPFKEESTKDSVLLTYKTETNIYPGTSIIYTIINNLKKTSKDNGAIATGFPMLNITPLPDASYKIMVALPINKELKNINGYFISRLVKGKFITAEVKGGDAAVNETLKNIQLYFQDYKRTTMAIPFQYLVTDRSREPDSTKWLTRIYAPVY